MLTVYTPSDSLAEDLRRCSTDRARLVLLCGYFGGIAASVEKSVARLADVEPRVPRGDGPGEGRTVDSGCVCGGTNSTTKEFLMGTRGAMGVRVNGTDKIGYVQFDSYPEGWPSRMVEYLRPVDLEYIKSRAESLRVVPPTYEPTQHEKVELYRFADLTVSRKSLNDIYCLLRQCQGDLEKTLDAGLVIDASEFLADSLFCEYAYIANLDENTFEVYRGFQEAEHGKGRYANMPQRRIGDKYWPVALVVTFPLDNIPTDWDTVAFPEEVEAEKS